MMRRIKIWRRGRVNDEMKKRKDENKASEEQRAGATDTNETVDHPQESEKELQPADRDGNGSGNSSATDEGVSSTQPALADEGQSEVSDQTVVALRKEVASLREMMEKSIAREQEKNVAGQQLEDLYRYCPELRESGLPQKVREDIEAGIPPVAAYALALRRATAERQAISALNEKNRELSSGGLSQGSGEDFFTADEVKAMNAGQVRQNYDKIMASMKHWH